MNRRTLQRSCSSCAKAKHGCDLRKPKCTRCVDKNKDCVYINEPLSSSIVTLHGGKRDVTLPKVTTDSPKSQLVPVTRRRTVNEGTSGSLESIGMDSFDPFDTYPRTSLPKVRVQGLIHHFLSKIIYQYYPWDTSPLTNPFITSWWQLALHDPALFQVSLQTASLDDELLAQKGFAHSEILMLDSIHLLREKVMDPIRAYQDETLDAVVTLAAIEHGKGNLVTSQYHIEGVKSMVRVRGGISNIKNSNPLTARMVSWVCMLVMGSPQFQPESDGLMDRLLPTLPDTAISLPDSHLGFSTLELDPILRDVLYKLRTIFELQNRNTAIPRLLVSARQDLASYVLHMILSPPSINEETTPMAESIRFATAIYMFAIHGPTYYSHVAILMDLVVKLQFNLSLLLENRVHNSLHIWLLSIGNVGSTGTEENEWFVERCKAISNTLTIQTWSTIKEHLKQVLWLDDTSGLPFRNAWELIIKSNGHSGIDFETDPGT